MYNERAMFFLGHETVGAWIGLGDAETENIFEWDGTQQLATYTNWNTNEPNNGGYLVEDCVEMTATKKWNDLTCNSEQSYFCERSPTGKLKSMVFLKRIIYVNNL
jgi:hypothetical protein